MEVVHHKGIHVKGEADLFVDCHGLKGKSAVITHAHSDHAKVSASNTYFMTPETALLLEAGGKNFSSKKIGFKKPFSLNSFDCTFHSSGHILGSAQVEVESEKKLVITSDFKLQKSILFEGAEILSSEVLVIETTFGTPEFSFPKREAVYEDMIHWVSTNIHKNRFVVLGGYAMGKAQELTKVVNEFLGEAPLVHKNIFVQNNAYKKVGVKLGDFVELNHNLKDANVLILPPNLIRDDLLFALEHQIGKKVEPAIATGWRRTKYKTFPLSDHADFNALMEYVKNSEPKMVYTTHGFEKEFANSVRRKFGISARPLSMAGQKSMLEFALP